MKKQDDPKNNKNNNSRYQLSRLVPIFLAVTLGSVMLQSIKDSELEDKEVSYGELVDKATQGQVSDITLRGREITATLKAGGEDREVTSYVPAEENAFERFNDKGVNVTAKPVERGGFASFLFAFGPVLIIVGAIAYLMNKQMGGGGLTKSPAKLLDENSKKVTFDDVAGIDEAKTDLKELVGFLKDPDKYSRLGGAMPKGALLIGPPGTGKTLIARAVAGEADVPFYRTSGSDFVEMYAGRGAGRVREMFAEAKKKAPCIIFIDEIDAIGGKRGSNAGGGGGGHNEREQTLNQLLVEMDGFEGNEGVVIIAATNRPDTLDDALMRPGRFDRQITVPAPDMRGRMQILEVHMRKIPHLADDVSIHDVAIGTPGFSGAELANLVNEAALTAVRNDHDAVYMSDFESAKDKIMMGAELSSLMMSKEEKELTAYHEAGHALMAILQEESDPIHKATIIPRGRALGMVMRLPENDRVSITKAKLNADLIVAMGGRIAEEIHTGSPDKVTTGAAGDIQQATDMARKMITEWGFSEELGRVRYAEEQNSFTKKFSEATSKVIDDEVKRIVEDAYSKAEKMMKENKDKLENIAQALIKHETLTGQEVKIAADGGRIEQSVPRKYQAGHGGGQNNKPSQNPQL